MDELEWSGKGAVSRVKGDRTGRRFLVSTACAPHGTWETFVFETNRFFIPKGLKPLRVINSSTPQQAREEHAKVIMELREEQVSQPPESIKPESTLKNINALNLESAPLKETSSPWRKIEKASLLGAVACLAASFLLSELFVIPMIFFLVVYTVVNRIQ